MNFSILKKIAVDIALAAKLSGKAIATAEGYGPILNSFFPASVASKVQAVETRAASTIDTVDHIVKTVEAIGALFGMEGTNKLDAAAGLAVTAFSDSLSLAGHDVQDEDLLQKAKDEMTQAVRLLVQSRVDFLNSLKHKD